VQTGGRLLPRRRRPRLGLRGRASGLGRDRRCISCRDGHCAAAGLCACGRRGGWAAGGELGSGGGSGSVGPGRCPGSRLFALAKPACVRAEKGKHAPRAAGLCAQVASQRKPFVAGVTTASTPPQAATTSSADSVGFLRRHARARRTRQGEGGGRVGGWGGPPSWKAVCRARDPTSAITPTPSPQNTPPRHRHASRATTTTTTTASLYAQHPCQRSHSDTPRHLCTHARTHARRSEGRGAAAGRRVRVAPRRQAGQARQLPARGRWVYTPPLATPRSNYPRFPGAWGGYLRRSSPRQPQLAACLCWWCWPHHGGQGQGGLPVCGLEVSPHK